MSSVEPFVDMLQHLREPLMIVAQGGRIIAANVACSEALATALDALSGAALGAYASDPNALASQRPFPLRSRDGRRFFCDARRLDSDLFLCRLSGGPEADARAERFYSTLARVEGMGEESAHFSQAETWHVLLVQGVASVGAVACGVFEVDEGGVHLELKGSLGYGPEAEDRFRMVPLAAEVPLTDAVKRATTILLATPESFHAEYPGFARAHPDFTQLAMALVPLELEGHVIGVLSMAFPMPWRFDDDARAALRSFAASCANVLAHSRDADGMARAADAQSSTRIARLLAFTQTLAAAITPTEVVEAIVDMGMTAAAARSCGLWLLSPDGSLACLARSVGPTGPRAEDYQNVPLVPAGRMPILDVLRMATPIWIESCRQMEELYPLVLKAFSRGGQAALACIPLIARGRCIGGLALNYAGVHRFAEDERTFLQVLAWHATQAIERARLFAAEKRAREEAEASRRRSEFLAHAGALLAGSLDYGATLARLVEAAVPQIADWCVVELEAEQPSSGDPAMAHADPSKLPLVLEILKRWRERGDPSQGIARVVRSGKSALYADITPESLRVAIPDDEYLIELYGRAGLTSAMVVLIAARGHTLGAIALNSSTRRYDERDLAMAEELGRIAGLAVDNARLYRDSKDAERQKDEFLAMVSHELRNPLAPIASALQVMDLSDPGAFVRERGIISRHVEHVSRLVGDLLEVARVTRGKLDMKKERCELAAIIGKALEMAAPLFEERHHRFTSKVPAAGIVVDGDQGRLAQVIANVLANAAKYTGSGGEISIEAASEHGEVVIRVRDSGVGIAPELLPKVFDMFVQAPGTIDRADGGLGIGLAVAKTIVELHGGTIAAHSAGVGHGTEVAIRLPLATGDAPAVAAVPVAAPIVRGVRVLVVDDNRDAAEMLAATLGALGCTTTVVHDGASALLAAAEFQPHLALVDIGLPIMNGYELADRLRRLDGIAAIKLVALTAYGEHADVTRARAAGFDEHILKPIGLDMLRALLAAR
jgi:signal transduction histidine kinase/CheY-like chemotaxis protein